MLGHLVLMKDDRSSCRVIQSERDQDGKHVSPLLPQLRRNLFAHSYFSLVCQDF